MLRKIAFMFCMVGAIAFSMACSDDSGKAVKKDGGGVKLDTGGGGKKDTGGGGKKDGGGGGKKDGGGGKADAASIKDCLDIANCVSKCGSNQTCSQKCISSAPAAAQTKFKAYNTCVGTAVKGSCASKCKDQKAAACTTCWKAACKKELDACQGTGGPAVAGFGNLCSLSKTGECKTGLKCVGAQGLGTAGKGWCSKTCPASTSGKPCNGSPTGTQAFCALKESATSYYCIFACKLSTQSWKCPSTLTCGTVSNGQAFCEPK